MSVPTFIVGTGRCGSTMLDFSKAGITHFDSVLWVFRSLVDMPADMRIDTVRITSRRA